MLEAVIVGAGQAGLAVGYHLAARGADHLLLDAGEGPGGSWRRRDSGLYLIGQSWQWHRGSALLGWVGGDARHLDEVMGSPR